MEEKQKSKKLVENALNNSVALVSGFFCGRSRISTAGFSPFLTLLCVLLFEGMEWSCKGCETGLVLTSQHWECLVAAQHCSMCRVMKRNCWDEKQVWWAPAVVKHKKRISWFLVLVGNVDRPPKWEKDLQSSESAVGYAGVVTSG